MFQMRKPRRAARLSARIIFPQVHGINDSCNSNNIGVYQLPVDIKFIVVAISLLSIEKLSE
jgi:hypothetical protein